MVFYSAHILIDKPKSLSLSALKKLRISLSTGYSQLLWKELAI